jgi:hypothetical protein
MKYRNQAIAEKKNPSQTCPEINNTLDHVRA